MTERYKCTLSSELLAKAVKELNEPANNSERLTAIDLLKANYYAANPNLPLIYEDDGFLLRFLRARKFDQEKALAILTNFHQQRQQWPEVFDKVRNSVLLKDILDIGVVIPLAEKAKNGCTVVVARFGLANELPITDTFAALVASLEKILEDECTQIYGIVVVQDLAYFGADFVKQMTPDIAKRVFGILQDAMPLRLKQVNITNEPRIFDAFFVIVQPFLKEKTKKRLQLHGTDFSKLYDAVDRSVLPFMFAGSGAELDVQGWKVKLLKEGTAL